MSTFDIAGRTALITGASAGLGAEFARNLASRAKMLVLVARREDRLASLRDEFATRFPTLQVIIHAADLADAAQVNALCERLVRDKINVDLLINNAGVGDHGTFVSGDSARVTSMIAVNITALSMLTRALVPTMIERKCGAVLNVSSSASFLPIVGLAAYAATKAYVTSLSEALRMELHGTGVHVTALCPGPVHTEFGSVAARPSESGRLGPELTYVSAEKVVRAALAGVKHNRAIVIPGLVMKLAMFLLRLTPMAMLRLIARATTRN